ncbi:MAG: hypothetical protein ACI4DU_01240 [Lachnospiraceae bacterium]
MSIGGVGQNYYHNNVETKRNTKNVNGTEKFALEKTGSTQELSEAEELELFKKEIWNEINSMPWGANTSIQITDEAFRKMMEDGEFKNKMMKIVREDAIGSNKMCGGTLINIDENGYKGYSYMADHAKEAGTAFSAHSKDKDAFYVKKAEKKREYMKLLEEKRLKQELLDEKIAKSELERSRLAKTWAGDRQRAKASNAYDANVVTETVSGRDSLFG